MIELSSVQSAVDNAARDGGVEGRDDARKATLRPPIVLAHLLGSSEFVENLAACLDAIRRGYYPPKDALALVVIERNAAIAGAQLESRLGQSGPGADDARVGRPAEGRP